MVMNIIDLIPYGYENAIKRDDLTISCLDNQLITDDVKDKDRQMRKLVHNARMSNAILTRPDGGYYRPTKDDAVRIISHINSEYAKAKKIFIAMRYEMNLLSDLNSGRI